MQEWWGGHLAHVQHHHANEDAIANPFIRARVRYPAKLEDDHVTLQAMLVGRHRLPDIAVARHVIGCQSTQETRVQTSRMTWRAISARPYMLNHIDAKFQNDEVRGKHNHFHFCFQPRANVQWPPIQGAHMVSINGH